VYADFRPKLRWAVTDWLRTRHSVNLIQALQDVAGQPPWAIHRDSPAHQKLRELGDEVEGARELADLVDQFGRLLLKIDK
jgi:hypothetical protein